MQEPGQYSRAPVAEAIIDLRVTLSESFPVEKFAEIHSHIMTNLQTWPDDWNGYNALAPHPNAILVLRYSSFEWLASCSFRSREG